MRISRTVSYAVQAALHLAEAPSDEPVPCSRIAAQGHMPERVLHDPQRGQQRRTFLGVAIQEGAYLRPHRVAQHRRRLWIDDGFAPLACLPTQAMFTASTS